MLQVGGSYNASCMGRKHWTLHYIFSGPCTATVVLCWWWKGISRENQLSQCGTCINLHRWSLLMLYKCLNRTHAYFYMSFVVRGISLCVTLLLQKVTTPEESVPALSLQQSERITSNRWFTDEVRLWILQLLTSIIIPSLDHSYIHGYDKGWSSKGI